MFVTELDWDAKLIILVSLYGIEALQLFIIRAIYIRLRAARLRIQHLENQLDYSSTYNNSVDSLKH